MQFKFRKRHIKDLYFYLILLYSGGSILFFRSLEGLIFIFIIGILVFKDSLFKPSKPLSLALIVWMIYFIINTIVMKSFHPYFMLTYIVYIFITSWLVSFYKQRILIKYEDAVYVLSLISLFFYLWQVGHFNSLYNLIRFFDLSQDMFPNRGYASIIMYSIRSDMNMLFPRNSGFTWEPGPFSLFVGLAIFFNLIRNKLILKSKMKLFVFVLVILTTQSTTGYIFVLILVSWMVYSRAKNLYLRFLIMPFVILIVLMIYFNVPFLQEKIISESQQDIEIVIDESIKYETTNNPGRFASFHLGWIDFKNHPIVGIGGHSEARYASLQGADVSTINGFAMIMTRYGSVGLLLFFILIIRTGKYLSDFYEYKGYLVFPLLLLIISFSFDIIESPILIALWMSSLFFKKPNYYKKIIRVFDSSFLENN